MSAPTGFLALASFSRRDLIAEFTPFDRFAQFREEQGRSLADLLDEFAASERRTLRTLNGWRLTDAQLSLEGEHPELGPVTFRQLLAPGSRMISATLPTARVMAKQYRDSDGQAGIGSLSRIGSR